MTILHLLSGNKEYISTEDSYVGYYADVDGDGNADGVIYADLAIGGSGSWNGVDYLVPTAEAGTQFKDYSISGTNKDVFDEEENGKGVLTATGEGKEERFYVMDLEDVSTSMYTFSEIPTREGWNVPNRNQWYIFLGTFGIDSSTYSTVYNLSDDYWDVEGEQFNLWANSINVGATDVTTSAVRLSTCF